MCLLPFEFPLLKLPFHLVFKLGWLSFRDKCIESLCVFRILPLSTSRILSTSSRLFLVPSLHLQWLLAHWGFWIIKLINVCFLIVVFSHPYLKILPHPNVRKNVPSIFCAEKFKVGWIICFLNALGVYVWCWEEGVCFVSLLVLSSAGLFLLLTHSCSATHARHIRDSGVSFYAPVP